MEETIPGSTWVTWKNRKTLKHHSEYRFSFSIRDFQMFIPLLRTPQCFTFAPHRRHSLFVRRRRREPVSPQSTTSPSQRKAAKARGELCSAQMPDNWDRTMLLSPPQMNHKAGIGLVFLKWKASEIDVLKQKHHETVSAAPSAAKVPKSGRPQVTTDASERKAAKA